MTKSHITSHKVCWTALQVYEYYLVMDNHIAGPTSQYFLSVYKNSNFLEVLGRNILTLTFEGDLGLREYSSTQI